MQVRTSAAPVKTLNFVRYHYILAFGMFFFCLLNFAFWFNLQSREIWDTRERSLNCPTSVISVPSNLQFHTSVQILQTEVETLKMSSINEPRSVTCTVCGKKHVTCNSLVDTMDSWDFDQEKKKQNIFFICIWLSSQVDVSGTRRPTW